MVSKALRGGINVISPTGYVEGWAVSNANYYEAVQVRLARNDRAIGAGIANLYRPDLVAAGIGHGWHGFRIRIDEAFGRLRVVRLSLVEFRTGSPIATAELPCPALSGCEFIGVQTLLDDCDLEVTDFHSLALTRTAIDSFIIRHGLAEFVERGYCYVLGRPADSAGRANYVKLIASGEISPLNFLSALFNSDERRQAKWSVLAPSDPGFAFTPQR
jgi:hypothetical protein